MSDYTTHKELPIINNLTNEFAMIERDITRKINTENVLNLLKDEVNDIIKQYQNMNDRCLKYINDLNTILYDFEIFKSKLCEAITNKGVDVDRNDSLDKIVSKMIYINIDDFATHFNSNSIKSTSFQEKNMVYAPMIDTSNITNMYRMFSKSRKLKSIPIYNTESATNINSMFAYCDSLSSIPKLNFSKVTDSSTAFSGTKITKFINDTTVKLENSSSMFENCPNLLEVYINISEVSNAMSMFSSCTSLETIEFVNGTDSLRLAINMFSSCSNLTSVKGLNTSRAFQMNNIFYNCSSLKDVYLDTSSGGDMSNAFKGCVNLTKLRFNPDAGNIANFSISDCTKMTSEDLVAMFESLPTPKASRTITLGDVLLNRLTEEQKQIAINKNYVLA